MTFSRPSEFQNHDVAPALRRDGLDLRRRDDLPPPTSLTAKARHAEEAFDQFLQAGAGSSAPPDDRQLVRGVSQRRQSSGPADSVSQLAGASRAERASDVARSISSEEADSPTETLRQSDNAIPGHDDTAALRDELESRLRELTSRLTAHVDDQIARVQFQSALYGP